MSTVEGWTIKPLSEIADITMGQSPDSKYYTEEEKGLPFIQGCAEFNARFPKAKLYCTQIKKIAPKSSILFSVRAPVGRINIANQAYIIGRGLAAISGKNVNQDFLEKYIAHQEPFFRVASQGSTFEAINTSELNKWQIHFPNNCAEQTKIAEILSCIDTAIEQTEAMIAKQQRIKTGLMQDLLSKGIDEHGNIRTEQTHAFKDSELGRIPVEWEVVPFGEVALVERGKFTHRPRNDPRFYGGNFPFIQTGDITTNIGRYLFNFSQTLNEKGVSVSKEFPAGTIAITIAANIADTAILGKTMFFPDSVVGAIVNPPNNVRFIELSIRTKKQSLNVLATQSAQKNINLETLRPLLLKIPPISEQNKIALLYEQFDADMLKNENSLNKLYRLKTALMQDLLSGNVRVNQLIEN